MWCAHGVLQFRDANMSCGETAAKIAKQSDWQQGRCLQDPASGSAWALVMCSWRLLLFAHFTRKLSWLTSYKWWLLKYHGFAWSWGQSPFMGASRGGRVTSRGGRAEQPFDQKLFHVSCKPNMLNWNRVWWVCTWCFIFDMCSMTKKNDDTYTHCAQWLVQI